MGRQGEKDLKPLTVREWAPAILRKADSQTDWESFLGPADAAAAVLAERDQLRLDCEKHLRCNANQVEIIQRLRAEIASIERAVGLEGK